jgi:mRNA-degrading endonuclease RelE of RelBE toxin-antitoxin system
MEFRIADTFTDSLTRLTRDEQKAVKAAAFDLQLNPANPGISFHRLDKAKDKNFWSVRVGSDIRLIVHKTASSFLLCYVDHHDKAYAWAERRKLETHPKTGAAQLVEIRERVEEIAVPVYVEVSRPKPPKPPLFAHLPDEVLLGYGVPVEWLTDVRQATEDSILTLSDHLPGEAGEALLELATGGKPQVPQPVPTGANPFTHPDALRRFRVMSDVEELERAFTYPWEKWTIFLHPSQREWVERDYSGPARVSGSAGTGKTIVALHRAVFLARANPDSRVLLTTFSDTLADALRTKLRRLISNEPRLGERLEVHAMNAIGERLYEQNFGRPKIASPEVIRRFMTEAAAAVADLKFGLSFLLTEWEELVDAWQLQSWESYRDIKRLGRKTRLQESQRAILWGVLDAVRGRLHTEGFVTHAEIFTRLAGPVGKPQASTVRVCRGR